MNNQITIDQLKKLKLFGMAEEFAGIVNLPMHKRPGIESAMAKMVEAEQCHRNKALTERLLKASHLHGNACIQDIECSIARNFTEAMLEEVSDCSFVRRGENILITGMTGCGKPFLAKALGRQACILGMRTEYLNMNRFVDTIAQAKLDGTFQKLLDKLGKNDLLILDEFGLQPMTPEARLALLQILEERYEEKSMIIISQLPLDKWYDYISDATLADAIMDRLVNTSTHFDLKGESMRRKRRFQ